MAEQRSISLGDLARQAGAELSGDPTLTVDHVATLEEAGRGAVTFLANTRYRRFLATTKASAVVLSPEERDGFPGAALVSDNPYLVFARVAQLLLPVDQLNEPVKVHPTAQVHPQAVLAPDVRVGAQAVIGARAQLAEGVVIGAGTVLGADVRVGADSLIAANVTIADAVIIGARAVLHPGVVIGADGFGFANDAGRWVKVPQTGSVQLGDDVEIGANSCVDRGALGDTIIGEGVKIDNLVQVGHNVRIGAHTAIAGCVAIAGSTTIGKGCLIGGAVGIAGHLTIADGVTVTAMTGVSRSIRKRGVYSGSTLMQPSQEWRRNLVRSGQLDEMYRRLRELERELADMKKKQVGNNELH